MSPKLVRLVILSGLIALAIPAMATILFWPDDPYVRVEFEDQSALIAELESVNPEAALAFAEATRLATSADRTAFTVRSEVAHLKRALELVPDSDVAMRRLGVHEYFNGRGFKQALQLLEDAYALRPRTETAAWYSLCLYNEFVSRETAPGTLGRVYELAIAAAEAHPSDLQSLKVAAGSASRLDERQKRARVLDLALQAIDAGRRELEFLGFAYGLAAELNDRDTVERLFVMTDGVFDSAPVHPRRLELRARAAHFLERWSDLRRIARHFDTTAPDSAAARLVNDLMEDSPGAERVRALKKRFGPVWEVRWLRRIVGGLLAVLAPLGFFFGIRWAVARRFVPTTCVTVSETLPEPSPASDGDEESFGAIIPPASEPPVALIWGEVTLLTVIAFLVVPLVGFGLQLSLLGPFVFGELNMLSLLSIQATGLLALGTLMRRWTCGSGLRPSGNRSANALMGLVYGAAMVGAGALAAVVLKLFEEPSQEQTWIRELMQSEVTFALLLPIAGLVAPLAEEVFFRGYVFERLRQAGRLVPAYVLSACLFAAVHGNLAATPIYLVQGILLSRAYDSRRSIMTAFIAHAVNNLVAAAVLAA